ncbi:class I mannose-6-phosphate isomerase [Sphingomonas sp.]|uniref:class I mannose-6-phosphate isomerase n=1 Tax=Sphingomonas sp. TaxID=28214 RepID=UPI002EDAB34B
MTATVLTAHRVAKPWGRRQLGTGFPDCGPDQDPVGEIWFGTPGNFAPELLVKYIFTSERLSVQVHPGDAQAQAAGLPRGKDECWLILDAAPDSTIALGTTHPVERAALREAAIDGSIELLLDWKPVQAGDFFHVPSGTVHAIGAGITLIEVQQNSETTYRLYDYGRPRELHLDAGVAVADPVPYASPDAPGEVAPGRRLLVEGPTFMLERWTDARRRFALPAEATAWLIPIAGTGQVDGVAFAPGQCLSLAGTVDLRSDAGSDLLVAYAGDRRITLD